MATMAALAVQAVGEKTAPRRLDGRTLLAIVCMLYFGAGLNFSASSDRAAGDMLTETASDSSAHLISAVVAAPFVGWLIYRHHALLLRALRRNLIFSALLGWTALSALWSQDALHSATETVSLIGSVLILIWMALTFEWRRQLDTILLAGAVAGVLSVAVALALPGRGLDAEHGGAWQGIFYSKNHLGRMMLFFLSPAFYLGGKELRASYPAFLRWTYVALCLALIALSRSKTAWLITGGYLLLVAALRAGRRLRSLDRSLLLVSFGLALAGAAVLIAPNLEVLLPMMGGDITLTGRTQIWAELMVSISKHPWLGYGYNAFWGKGEGWDAFMRIYGTMHFAASYAHSGYIDLLLQVGTVGLCLVLAVTGITLVQASRLFGGAASPRVEWCCGVIFLCLFYSIDEVIYLEAKSLPWSLFVLATFNLFLLCNQGQRAIQVAL